MTPLPSNTHAPVVAPDASELSLGSIPRLRLGPRLWRWLCAAVVVQLSFAAAALLVLQGSWRSASSYGSLHTTAHLLSDRLTGHVMHPSNPVAKGALASITSFEGVSFAMVVDDEQRVVLTAGSRDSMPGPLRADPGARIFAFDTPSSDQAMRSHGLAILATQIDGNPTHRLIIGMRDPVSGRILRDGAAALCIGSAASLAVVVPLALLSARRSTKTLRDLHKSIRRLAKGVQPDPIALEGDAGVAFLGVAFNSMAGDILATQRALKDANATLEDRVTQRTEELRQANLALEHKNSMLADITQTALRFTDDVAHEFRTPLAVILEIASLIEDGLIGTVTEQQREHLGFIREAGRDMSSLVDDFLDTSRLRAGRLPVHRARHSVEEVLDAAWKILEVKASERKVRLVRTIPDALPCVYADLDKARRVLINLVVNAIKFSREGDEVRVEVRGEPDCISFRVIDHGPGMTEKELATLFDRFRQTSTGMRGNSKGFGLGLSITAELVALNLGDIAVQSKAGTGSVFTFTLPQFNLESILRQFLKGAAARAPEGRVGALLVKGASEDAGIDQLIESIIDRMQPTDVLIPCEGERHLMVVGVMDDPVEWRTRFEAPSDDPPDPAAPSLSIALVGTWPVSVPPDTLASIAGFPTPEEVLHA